MLNPDGAAERPSIIAAPQFHVAVERDVAAAPGAGRVIRKSWEAVRRRDEPLRCVRSHLPRRLPARPHREALVAPFGAGRDVDAVRGGIGDVEIEVEVLLSIESGVEVARSLRAERRVDGVLDEEVRLVRAVTGAGVPGQAVGRNPAHAAEHRHVGNDAPELRCEAARRDLLKRKTVGVGEHLRQRVRIWHVVGDPHGGGTVGRSHAFGGEHVADEQRPSAVERVDVLPRVGIPEVEALGHFLVRVVGVAVELHAIGEQIAEVAEQLQIVLDRRVAPDLHRIGHGGVAGRDERRRIVSLHAAVGRVGVAVLEAEIGEPVGAEREPDVAGEGVRVAVPCAVGAGAELQAAAGAVVLEQEIQHPGDGVRPVLRRRAVAQHFHLPQRD